MAVTEQKLVVGSSIGRFAIVPEWLLRSASDEAVCLYAFLGAVYANQRHECYPSLETIAADMRCKTGKVKRVMRELIQAGAVTVKRRRKPNGEAVSNFYILHVEQPGSKNDPFPLEPWSKNDPSSMDQKSTMVENPENAPKTNYINELLETSQGSKIDPKPYTQISSSPPLNPPTPEWLRDLWNSQCGSLPQCVQLSSKRRSVCRRRAKEQPDRAVWERVVKAIAADPGCNGKNRSGWRASFDYFIDDDTWLKVVEGRLARGSQSRSPEQREARTANEVRTQVRDANVSHVAEGDFHIVGDTPEVP